MRNSRNTSRRQTLITIHRFFVAAMLVTIAIGVFLDNDTKITSSSKTDNSVELDKVEKAAQYIETMGFTNPVYLGILPGTEGDWPTFRATAIGDAPVELIIRTTGNGGYEVQPDALFHTITSAEDLASIARTAVREWEDVEKDGLEPRNDGAYGEYESRKFRFDHFGKYDLPESYWDQSHAATWDGSEAVGWPEK